MLGLFCCFVVSVTITFGLVYCGRCGAGFMLCFPIGLVVFGYGDFVVVLGIACWVVCRVTLLWGRLCYGFAG